MFIDTKHNAIMSLSIFSVSQLRLIMVIHEGNVISVISMSNIERLNTSLLYVSLVQHT